MGRRSVLGFAIVAITLAMLAACGGDDDDDVGSADDVTTTAAAEDDSGDEGDDDSSTETTAGGDDDGGDDCPLTAEEVSEIIGGSVEEQPDLRTGADCQYTGGGLHIVLGVRGTSGLSADEFIDGSAESFDEEAERVDDVGDAAAFIGSDDYFLAFSDDQVISVLGAPTRDDAIELAEAVIAGL
jgi:hypothetical protein